MNKWSKLAQFVTLISTFIALGIVLYLFMREDNSFPKEKFNEMITTQNKQGEDIQTLKKDVDTKIETQNNVILEFDKRITEVEETQTEFLTIMADSEKKPTQPQEQQPPAQQEQQPTQPPVQPEQPQTFTIVVTSNNGIHLRNEANEQSKSLGIISYGTKITVIGGPEAKGKYNWYKVQTGNGTVGWVAKEFTQQ